MKLPNDIARCDGLLPKKCIMPNGAEGVLWMIDCPKRESCARFLQLERDMNLGPEHIDQLSFTSHYHKPTDKCPDYIKEK